MTDSIIDKLERDNPLFHNDGKGGLISWNSNMNLLRVTEGYLREGMRTIEIGSGYSTVTFTYMRCFHTCIVSSQDEVNRIRNYCIGANIPMDRIEFIIGQSHEVLPVNSKKNCDLIFIDGAHRFPFPIVDWFYCALLLKEGGLMAIDDTDIISCHILLKFMLNDLHWEKVEVKENFGIFRKKGGHDYPFDWPGQPFSSNKINDSKDLEHALYPCESFSQKNHKNSLREKIRILRKRILP